MGAEPTYVIVGAGQAGGWAAQTMRAEGFHGRIVLIGEEAHPPHERPPLSKRLLIGDSTPEETYLRPRAHYAEHDIELRLGVRATSIDRGKRRVRLFDGEALPYDKLLLATGSRVSRLAVPGADRRGVFHLRRIEDTLAIRTACAPGARLVVVGGGYIGLEVAAAARRRGCRVTVLESQDMVMKRVIAPEIGRFFAELHRGQGVDLRLGAAVAALEGAERVERVVCADGTSIPADLVVVGIGVIPDTDLAAAAGLAVDNGVVVDAFGRTPDPCIFAAGDVTSHYNPLLGRRLHLESWQNAQNQAISAARAMCGNGVPYAEVPWFWSDQYDVSLQMVGAPERWDRLIVRGDMTDHSFSVLYLLDGVVVAANAVNSARDIAPARMLIRDRKRVDPGRLADTDTPLKMIARG